MINPMQTETSQIRGVHRGLPSWFNYQCIKASRRGSTGYRQVGYSMAFCFNKELPIDIEAKEWTAEIKVFIAFLDADQLGEAWKWFAAHYPKFAARIPWARRRSFIDGFADANSENDLTSH